MHADPKMIPGVSRLLYADILSYHYPMVIFELCNEGSWKIIEGFSGDSMKSHRSTDSWGQLEEDYPRIPVSIAHP